ncbi:MAG: T9SS type A sorting domain-containing protein [Ferruginibacter sp.]
MKKINSVTRSGSINLPKMFMFRTPKMNRFFKTNLLLAICTLWSVQSFCADGDPYFNHIKRQYQVSEWGNTKWGLEYLPDDFNTTTQKYPIIFFFHGIGETGSTEGTLNKLLNHGPSNFIAYSNYNMQFTNPNTGQTQKFIYVALQDPYWSPNIYEIWYIIKNNPRLKDRISNIFYTGLSAGGQQTMMSVLTNQEMANGITAVVPMSSAGWDKTGVQYARNASVKAWCFHGITDGTCPYTVTRDFNDSLGPAKSRWTNLPPSHGNWNSIYTQTYREVINGKLMNIYEWMLSTIAPNQAPVADAGPDQVFGAPVSNTNLNGNGMDQDGFISTYSWVKLSGPSQYSILNVANPATALTNLTSGTYTFELTVTDNLGATGKDTITITDNTVPTTIPIKISDFNLRENNGINLLQWKTVNEVNSDYFSIERSSNGRSFTSIGRVNASGYSSTEITYNFTDQTPLKDINYYRLLMVDKDGHSEYSKILSTSSKNSAALDIINSNLSYSGGNLKIVVNSSQSKTANLALVDANGRILLNTPVTLQKGVNSIEKSTGTLSKGIYYIKLFTEDDRVVKSIMSND